MRKLLIALLMTTVGLAAADLDNNTVTVTATRVLDLQPDQALLYVSLRTVQNVGLDDVLAMLKGTGIDASNLQNLSETRIGQFSPSTGATSGVVEVDLSQWNFLAPMSFSKMKDSLQTLAKLQSTLGVIQNTQALTFSLTGLQTSADARAAQPCPLTALVSDARRQADSLAAAAGMKTGAVVSLSDTPAPVPLPTVALYIPATLSGFLLGLPDVVISSPQPACTLTVQFKLQ